MSGTQEPRINLPTWRFSDFNAAIPIKKRKYFVQPQLQAADEENNPKKPYVQGDETTSVGRNVMDSSEKQKQTMNVGEPTPLFPSVSFGNADKAETFGDKVGDRVRVKVEEETFPIHSTPLAGFEIPSSSNLFANSLRSSLGKLPVGVEHPGVVVTSGDPGMRVEHTLLKTHDVVRGECQTDVSAGVATVSRQIGCNAKNSSLYWENEEPTSLSLSLSKGICAPHITDSISVCTKPGNHSGVNRSNWDLNTTMDDWEDAPDHNTKTTGALLNINSTLNEIETSSCCDTTAISKSVSGKQKESVGFRSPTGTSMQINHQLNPICSLSLGRSSYHPIEKSSSLAATTSEARPACTSFFRTMMIPGNVNPVNLRTVKSEVIEESVRQETDSAQVCPIGLSIKKVEQEVTARFSQENIPSSGILKPVDRISVKAEPNSFTQSEVFSRRNRMLNYPHTPRTQPNEILDLPTGSMPNQKDAFIPYSNDISNTPISSNGIDSGAPIDLDYTLKENRGQGSSISNGKLCQVTKHGGVHMTYSCSGHEDHNLNASGVNVTSLTEKNILDDRKTCVSKELSRNTHGTDELSISDKGKSKLSGKEPEEELFGRGFESDCGRDLSSEVPQQVEKRSLYDDSKVRGPADVIVEGNEGVVHAGCGGSETEQRGTAVPFHIDSQNTNCVEKGSQPAELGNTYSIECFASSSINKLKKYTVDDSYSKYVEMGSTEVQINRLTPEFQSSIFDGSGENEGRIVQDGEQSTQQTIHASEGTSGVSTLSVSGGNVENPETVDNNSPVSYKAEISTIDNESPAEYSEGSQGRIVNLAQVSNKSLAKTLDASDSFAPLQMERDRLPDFPLEPRKYVSRGRDDSCNFSHGRYQRSPRINFIPDGRRLSDQTESNPHERNTKSFEFDNYGNPRRGNAFMSSFHRGRRPANGVASNSFPRRTPSYLYTHRGQSNKEDASTFHGFRDGENFTRELQCNNTEPRFTSPPRPYQGRNSFARGRAKYLNNPKRDFPGFRSRSPVRSRERSAGPSSSFRNRSQEEVSGHTDFSHRRSPSGYRMGKISSPDHSGYPREMVRRNNSPSYSHRPSNAGRGRGYSRGRGYARGRGYGRDGSYFRKPYDRTIHRNHGSLNNLDPRERVDYNDYLSEGPIHSGRFGVDVNAERRQFGYRHDDTSSFRPPYSDDGCAPSNVDPDAVKCRQDLDTEIQDEKSLMELDGQNQNSTENTSGRNRDMEEEEKSG